MIISHKYKFIFLKPAKTASTSVEIALAKHCGDEDVVTPLREFLSVYDGEAYVHHARNYKEKGYYHHINPDKIEKMVGPDMWNTYFKFTIVRNPWDLQISWLWWKIKKVKHKKGSLSHYIHLIRQNMTEFQYYVDYFNRIRRKITKKDYIWLHGRDIPILDNTRYYFDRNGNPICDFYIRYENLQEDCRQVCEKLGIPYEKLPLTKDKVRDREKYYSQYYDEETKRIIEKYFKKEIEYFGYKFEIA